MYYSSFRNGYAFLAPHVTFSSVECASTAYNAAEIITLTIYVYIPITRT